MTFDINTIPSVEIKPGVYGTVEIEENQDGCFLLKHSDTYWHIYEPSSIREYCEQWSGYDLAYGDVLLSGFGFGHMLNWVASKPEVKTVTVIESSPDVVTAYLANNDMPKNVSVIIDDANTFVTNKKYDCIIYDHIQNGQPNVTFYKNVCQAAKNIPHDLLWFWSIEFYYAKYYYKLSWEDLYVNNKDLSKFDFSKHWEFMRKVLDMSTIPILTKNKITSYINSYFML